ncbi:MAG TPA: DUF6370 family protein [Candidatus Limnocylindrales bacterium]|nr:DUF6370 family protein [Candidatus Limnocylindrales bacterium]
MRLVFAALAALLFLQPATAASADETTIEGNIICAKCNLKTEGLRECQNVLSVKDDAGAETHYWLAKNEVAKAYGEVCMDVRPVTVTGTVEDKGGKKWIAPSKIDPRPGS